MSNVFWLTNEQVARLRPYFPKSYGKRNRTRFGNLYGCVESVWWRIETEDIETIWRIGMPSICIRIYELEPSTYQFQTW